MTESKKEREPSDEARAAARWLPDYRKHESFALALEDCIDARIRLQLTDRDRLQRELEASANRERSYAQLVDQALRERKATKAELLETRSKLAGAVHAVTDAAEANRCQFAELESLRSKPLEGELAEALEYVREVFRLHVLGLRDQGVSRALVEEKHEAAIFRIEAALRAKAAPPDTTPDADLAAIRDVLRGSNASSHWAEAILDRIAERLRAKEAQEQPAADRDALTPEEWDAFQRLLSAPAKVIPALVELLKARREQEQPAAAPEPRPIVVGSLAPELPRKVEAGNDTCAYCKEPRRDHGACGKADNFACDSFVELIADAPEAGK